jgi:WD40-like Beta Propeller Repeat
MTDERIDALIRSMELPAVPSQAFADRTLSELRARARDARGQDRRVIRRLVAKARVARRTDGLATRQIRPSALALAAVVLLVLALIASALFVGAMVRLWPVSNGLLVVSIGGELRAIDVDTDSVHATIRTQGQTFGLTRSPDGRKVSFWTGSAAGSQLELADVDGQGQRRLAADVPMARAGCIDSWSSDSRSIASEVLIGRTDRILVTDVATDHSVLVTPPDVIAHCPLWSPDGGTLAFEHEYPEGNSALAVIGRDGTGSHDVSGHLGRLNDLGANSWSPDGSFVFFGAGRDGAASIFRSDVVAATSERLTGDDLEAYGPTLSPDGSLVSFMAWTGTWMDLYLMRSDGTDIHRILEHARNLGWSADGRYILAEWHAADAGRDGGLFVVTPADGTSRSLVRFEHSCPVNAGGQLQCIDGSGWGQPQP